LYKEYTDIPHPGSEGKKKIEKKDTLSSYQTKISKKNNWQYTFSEIHCYLKVAARLLNSVGKPEGKMALRY